MNTYFIGKEEAHGYIRDFLRRLEKFDPFPSVWCPITRSGEAVLKVIIEVAGTQCPALLSKVQMLAIEVDGQGKDIGFIGGDPSAQIPSQSVLLLDGAIHSGQMMSRCAAEVLRFKPAELCSYSLVVKSGAEFVPTLWGVMIEETARAFFLLDEIPNNRLDASGDHPLKLKKQAHVHLERLQKRHTERPAVAAGVKSMDRMTWSDRLFQMQASDHGPCTYVLVRGETIVGYLTVHLADEHAFVVDEIAIDSVRQGQGYGGVLLRFADTLARNSNCRAVRFLAIKDKIDFYKGFQYHLVDGRSPISLDDEEYWPMERPVLYHQSRLR